MQESKVFEQLLWANVLIERDERVMLSPSFEAHVESLQPSELPLQELYDIDNEIYAAYRTVLQELFNEKEIESEIEPILPILASIQYPPPRKDGVPAGFFPIRGEFVDSAMKITGASILYIWQGDCDPCERVRERLESTVADMSSPVACFAVHGPANAERLYNSFNVTGAPTILFVGGSTVASRLTGLSSQSAMEREIKLLLQETRLHK